MDMQNSKCKMQTLPDAQHRGAERSAFTLVFDSTIRLNFEF